MPRLDRAEIPDFRREDEVIITTRQGRPPKPMTFQEADPSIPPERNNTKFPNKPKMLSHNKIHLQNFLNRPSSQTIINCALFLPPPYFFHRLQDRGKRFPTSSTVCVARKASSCMT